jgi:acyl homoserine lactone synthase
VIECFTQATNHYFSGNPYAEQSRLRYAALKPQGWDVPFFDMEMAEVDQYDMPPTVYFLRRDEDLNPLVCVRLCRTDITYKLCGVTTTFMLKDIFMRHVKNPESLCVGDAYREGSRLCAAPELYKPENREARRRCVSETLIGVMEFSVAHGISSIYGTMPTKIYNSTWGSLNVDVRWLSDEILIEGYPAQLAVKIMSQETLERAREVTGFQEPVLNYGKGEKCEKSSWKSPVTAPFPQYFPQAWGACGC